MISTPRAGLKAIFARLANLPLSSVVWKGEIEPSNTTPPASLTVTGATNASPIVLTVPTTVHLATGASAVVAGIVGNTAANATWPSITVVDPAHVSLDGSTGNGAYVSGGTIAPVSPWRNGLLRIGASSRDTHGWDFTTSTDNADGTKTETTVGQRRVILGLDYFSFDSAASVMADDVLETVRTGLWHGNMGDAFTALAACAVTYGTVIPLPTRINGREISAAHLDVVVRLSAQDSNVLDRGAVAGKNLTIHEVKGTGTITKEDGTSTETEPLDVVGP